MAQLEDSIVLILSSDVKNTAFGTGFIIAHDQNYSYLLTCAHVLEQINGKNSTENKLQISGVNVPVEIVECGASDGIDIALLKVAGLFNKPLFEQFMLGQEKADIKVTGYSWLDSKNGQRVQRELNGKLSNRTKINSNNQEYPFLDIAIQDDDFSKLEGGYSGSPLYNSVGQVLGVVSHKRTGEMGHAFCISNLIRLYPDIETILPNFKQRIESSQKIFSLSDIRTRLMNRSKEIAKVFLKLRERLNRMEKEGMDDEAEFILQMCEDFLNGEMNAADFIESCFPSESSKTADNLQPNYNTLADSLKNGHVCLCLGTELPKLFDPKLNSAQELAQRIAKLTGFEHKNANELAAVCEYAQLRSSDSPRHRVVDELKKLVTPNYQPKIELYELLARLEKPFLVIATGFDTLLEQRLSKSGHSFVSIVINKDTNVEDQRYLLKGFNTKQNEIPSSCSGDKLSSLQLMEKDFSLIFYLRGYSDESDNLLLSERDYFNQAKELLNKSYPSYLSTKLKSKDLWFLGYQPDSWETRLIAKVLQQQRGGDNNSSKPLVIQANPDSFAQLFWEDMKCSHYPDLTVTDFVAEIGALI
jgi:hypothetical protein